MIHAYLLAMQVGGISWLQIRRLNVEQPDIWTKICVLLSKVTMLNVAIIYYIILFKLMVHFLIA